jgi:type II secretory pathway component PulC
MRLDFSQTGVVVIGIDGAGEARRFGFMVGDIVRDVNMVDVTSPNQLQQTLNASTGWDITVQRGNRTSTLSIR